VQSIQLIDAQKGKLLDQMVVGKAFYGLKFADNHTLYASGGNDNWIYRMEVDDQRFSIKDTIVLAKPWPIKLSPTGLDVDVEKNKLYVTTKDDSTLYVINISQKTVERKIPLGIEAYTCLLSNDKKSLFVSLWGARKVAIYATDNMREIAQIEVGENPNELLLSKDGKILFVANAGTNSVSVIDIQSKEILESLQTSLYPDAPTGSATNGLALSGDGKTLYVANADNNCLAVFDVTHIGESRAKGFIPVGWYPTNVKVVGERIFVTNGKGFSSFANANGPDPTNIEQLTARHRGDAEALRKIEYIGGLMKGTMSIIETPDQEDLAEYSQQVYKNSPYSKSKEAVASGEPGNPIPTIVGQPSPIRYVFYIIKENRTYDQVLGDIPEGNGDTSLVLFGEKYTPNQHKLVREFVLLDNFYVDGEVSADGHSWSMAAHANDYLEKTWVSSYGGRGGTYDSEGKRDIANPDGGFLWDYCQRAGISFRTYGEFVDDNKANIPTLEGHFCPYYPGYSTSIRDTLRFNRWRQEFDSLVAINQVPRLSTIRFGNDHTDGARVGRPTVFAHVADNDLAVGLFVEHLSKSKIWNESAVFIVEDDAQNGSDHVDAHRTTAYVAGPFVKRGYIDHTMYSTSSMLRTMELILGLPPMSQYDAAAEPMWRCFTNQADDRPFKAVPINVNLNDVNKERTWGAIQSESIDLSKEDQVPDLLFSKIIWKAVKGEDSEMPAPVRSAFLNTNIDEE
ncbi:MAG: bifunctional YncE family protein/alkaline phosphatase family protein, partial [Saprospiraceae bacterium]|nr:bifunctional YncE family protein/alkaline phosphatase family protein [Saprospiraceae bacterium]